MGKQSMLEAVVGSLVFQVKSVFHVQVLYSLGIEATKSVRTLWAKSSNLIQGKLFCLDLVPLNL